MQGMPQYPKETPEMQITHVSLTLFAWDDIPPTRYHAASRLDSGSSALGLLSIVVPVPGVQWIGGGLGGVLGWLAVFALARRKPRAA